MTESYARSNNVNTLHTAITSMLTELNQLDRKWMTEDNRDALIEELIENAMSIADSDTLYSLFREGCKGYDAFTDLELIDEAMGRYSDDMYKDFEFEHTEWLMIEQELLSIQSTILAEVVEKEVL